MWWSRPCASIPRAGHELLGAPLDIPDEGLSDRLGLRLFGGPPVMRRDAAAPGEGEIVLQADRGRVGFAAEAALPPPSRRMNQKGPGQGPMGQAQAEEEGPWETMEEVGVLRAGTEMSGL